jgi:cytochrome c oxidase assembly protein subunit 15
MVFLQCILGALTAGNHAGLVDADWPLMAGSIFPVDYWQGSAVATLVHGASAVQFNHRFVAYGLAIYAAMLTIVALRRRWPEAPLAAAILALIIVQMALGVAALWLTMPLGLALAHQLTGVTIFGAATVLAWRTRRSRVL